MKYIKKTAFYGTIIIALLIFTSSAYPAGFVFKWKPFVVDTNLIPDASDKKVLSNDSSASGFKVSVPEDHFMDVFDLSAERDNTATQKIEKKSFMDNIKINFSPDDSIMTGKQKMYSNSDEEQMSKFINATTSLIYDDKKIKSLETIGKIIEPQINFYFKF
jgi:hypothetical protein